MNLTDNISDSVTPVYNRRGNVVGCIRTIDGGRWLEKRSLNPAKHKLKRPPGWATDVKHIEELRRQGGVGMVIRTTDGEVLTATLDALGHIRLPRR